MVGDLSRRPDWRQALDGVGAVIHVAGLAHRPPGAGAHAYAAINVEGTVALAEAALGDGPRARALGHEACRMLDRSGDLTGHVGALNNLAVAEVLTGRPGQAIGLLEQALALRAIPSLGWQYMLLAGLREMSGEIAAAMAALAAARGSFKLIGDRRGLAAAAGLGRRLGAGERSAKRMQSPQP